jgi:glycosyltransferase involved in cell wall biosynthesis
MPPARQETRGRASFAREIARTWLPIVTRPPILLCGPPPSAVGGGPTHVRNLLASPLADRFTLVHFESGSRGSESPARDEPWLAKGFRFLTSPAALAWSILRVRPRVVHLNSAMDPKGFWRDFVYLGVAKALGRKTVLQLHGGSLPALLAKPAMRRMVRSVYSAADALVVLAQSEKRELAQIGVAARVFVIPNGVDVAPFNDGAERVHSGRVRRLAFMGRLIRAKGLFEAMEAARALRAEGGFRDLELRIAGSGPDRGEIEDWIRRNAMEQAVKLVGPVHDRDKIEFLREADVFVLPSDREGLPYAVLESLAAGTPVIATRVGGIPDVVVERVHGALIDARSVQQIVAAVHDLARSEEGLRAMSRECRMRAAREFSLERLAARFGELYERLGA